MPKGRKYSAAEKHFLELERRLNLRLQRSEESLAECQGKLSDAEKTVEELRYKNEELRDWIRRLLSYTEMSKEDLEATISHDKSVASAAKVFSEIMKSVSLFM
jgi:chromosome segregation ATPase